MTASEGGREGARLSLAFAAIVAAYFEPFRWASAAAWRQDIFAMRNNLWDRMRERGTLDAPAHREFREFLNAAIRIAPNLGLYCLRWMV